MNKFPLFASFFLFLIFSGGIDIQSAPSPIPSPTSLSKEVGGTPFPNPKALFTADGLPDYKSYYRDFVGTSVDQFFMPQLKGKDGDLKKFKDVGTRQAVMGLCWLAKISGDHRYLDRAHDLFGMLIDFANRNFLFRDCFGFPETLNAALMLKAAGSFDPAWEPELKQFTQAGVSALNNRFPPSDGNQDLARMYGCVLAKKLYPDIPEAVSASAKVNEAFTRFLKQGDLYTDSSNYYSVSLTYFILISHELGREQEFAKLPDFHRMFSNFAAAVSPNGYLPAWGSGYFSPNGYNYAPLFLEYAASLYHDPSFAAAAHHCYGQLIAAGPFRATNPSSASHFMGCLTLGLLDLYQSEGTKEASPSFISGVMKRNALMGTNLPGFLIMRPSLTPGAPMILMDLLSQGDHCEAEFSASIAYYESGHVPLFYQYGRYISGASRGNQIFFGEPGTLEPDPEWKEGTWRTVSIPTKRFTYPDGKTSLDGITLRTDHPTQGKDSGVVLDNMRLSGPGGTMPVCDLAKGEWRGNGHAVTEGKTPSSKAIQILNDGQGCGMKNFKPLSFDPEQYTELLCDVKWFGKTRPSAGLRMGAIASWTAIEQSTLLTILNDAQGDRHGEDCHARIEYSEYGTYDSKLVRQIVLTKEGVLAIHDDIMPGAAADDLPAFSLWQMYSIDGEGTNRFSSRGECAFVSCDLKDPKKYSRGMSVYFSGPAGMQSGKQVIPNGRGKNSSAIQRDTDLRTAYARVTMKSGQPTYLNLLVVPHPEDQDFAKLDAATSMTQDSETSSFKTVCDGVLVSIKIAKDGEWQVSR